MNVGLLIVTHSRLGHELLETARNLLGICPLQARAYSIPNDYDTDLAHDEITELFDELDEGSGVLVLTDMYGSTPSNIARRALESAHVNIVAGVNLPMLIRILNYPQLDLQELTDKAISGGRDGVVPFGDN